MAKTHGLQMNLIPVFSGYIAVMWLCRDWLVGELMKRVVADRDMLLLLFAALALISLVRDVFQCAVQALIKFKSMAYITAVSAVVSLSTIWFGIDSWGPRSVLIGQIAGETISVLGIAGLIWQARSRGPVPAAPDAATPAPAAVQDSDRTPAG